MFNWFKTIFQAKKLSAHNDFKLKLEGIDAERLIRIDGPNGVFYITTAGGLQPGRAKRMFYGDSEIQMFFVIEDDYTEILQTIEITHFAANFDLNQILKLSTKQRMSIKKNLEWFFSNRASVDFKMDRPETWPPIKIFFSGSALL